MENISVNMGERIREMRKSKGLTQEALSQAMGVSIQAVSKWETGQSLPDVMLLPALADYFDISIDVLFGRGMEPKQQSEGGNQMEPSSPFPDDDKIRVVQYQGARLLSAEECAGDQAIRLCFGEDPSGGGQGVKIEIEIQGSARIAGPVNGALNVAKDAYVDGDINGAANVQGDLTCRGNVNGSVRSCGNFTSRGTTTTVRVEAAGDSLNGLKGSLSGLGGMISGIFSGRKSGGAKMKAFFSGELPDDDIIRVVQLQGQRVMSVEESSGQRSIRLCVDHITEPLNVEVYGSAQIEGDIHGNASAGDAMTCGNVGGSASVGDSLTCGEIKGSASAGDAIRCGNIGGNATAGDGITCGTVGGSVRAGDGAQITGDVGGSVTAGDSVTCGNIHGNVKADSVKYSGSRGAQKQSGQPMLDVSGLADGALHIVQVMNGEVLSAAEARNGEPVCLNLEDADGISVHIHGNAQIQGDIEGDVHADGNVTCEDVEGDVRAGGQVTCADVEGDVSAGMEVTCADVEGDVSAGMEVTCATVEGNLHVQGDSDRVFVNCAEIEGDLTVLNASVTCEGAICGNVDVRGDGPERSIVICAGIEGDTAVLNASVNCQDGVISGNVDVRGEQPDKCVVVCGGVEGDVTALNASVNCQDGVISGNVDVRGEQPDKCVVVCGGVEGSVTARNATVSCGDGSVDGDIDAQSDWDEEA